MGIDSIGGPSGTFAPEVAGAEGTPALASPSAKPERSSNTVSAFSETAHDLFIIYGAAMSAAQLATSAGGKTTKQQAALFDFGALLGKFFEAAAGFFRGAGSDGASPTQSKPGAATAGSAPGTTAGAPEPIADQGFASAAKAQLDAAAPRVDPNGPTTRVVAEKEVRVKGETTIDGATFKGEASARVGAEAKASSSTFAGPDGVGAVAEASARAAVEVSVSGSITSDYGSVSGSAHASAEVYARAKVYATANTKGARAGAEVEVGARAEVDAKVDASTLGGHVTVHAEGTAEVGTGAKAQAKVGVSYDPLEAAVEAKAGAFAGARAKFNANGGIAGVKYGIAGEARAGVGLDAQVNAGLSDGKFKFTFGFGVSVGVGFALKLDFEIDLNAVGKAIGDLFGAVAGLFGGNKGDWTLAANRVAQLVASLPQAQEQLKKVNSQFDSGTSGEDHLSSRTTKTDEVDLAPDDEPPEVTADLTPTSTPDLAVA